MIYKPKNLLNINNLKAESLLADRMDKVKSWKLFEYDDQH
jgi:hypothetical protein|tara:strand:+ start:231 stop:350 length:120 start_codon:yes stop_codon:yes gene_type:complete